MTQKEKTFLDQTAQRLHLTVARQAQRIMTIRDGVLSGGDSHE